MIDLAWDGFLKANPVKDVWKKRQQEEFAKHLKEEEEEKEKEAHNHHQQQSEESEGEISDTLKIKEE